MSTSLSGLSGNFFPSPQNGFTTTTSGSVSSGAATVGLNSVAGYSNGQIATFVIDPSDTVKKQTFTGVVDTSGVQITSVVWTAGTNTTHVSGATVVDYTTATHIAQITKGILIEHKQTGLHSAVNADSIVTTGNITDGGTLAVIGTTTLTGALILKSFDGWITASSTWTYASAITFTVAGVDLTGVLQAGDRIKLTQTTAKYFIVMKVAFSTDTTVTIYGGTDYTLANAAITLPFYSHEKNPFGFNSSPAKWTVTTTSASDRTTTSQTLATLTDAITLPIGVWKLSLKAWVDLTTSTTNSRNVKVTLSSDATTETDEELTVAVGRASEASTSNRLGVVCRSEKDVTLAASTTFTMMGICSAASLTCSVLGSNTDTVIRGVCGYL